MLRVALTGGIASGKSTVADIFASLGAQILDYDVLSRQVCEPGEPAWQELRQLLGDSFFFADGSLDRAKLGDFIFSDEAARARIAGIIQRQIFLAAARADEQYRMRRCDVVIHVIPLLVETNLAADFDRIIVVDLDEDSQLRRLIGRNNYSAEQAWRRISAQASRKERLEAADYVIDNREVPAQLLGQVKKIWGELLRI